METREHRSLSASNLPEQTPEEHAPHDDTRNCEASGHGRTKSAGNCRADVSKGRGEVCEDNRRLCLGSSHGADTDGSEAGSNERFTLADNGTAEVGRVLDQVFEHFRFCFSPL